ncbi:MAG: Lrp/AsnC family transcriptional regulator, partial [Betaproteobacteria bacterium]
MLDKFDLAILDELQRDGRLTNAELAARVGLSAAPCWRRVRAAARARRSAHAPADVPQVQVFLDPVPAALAAESAVLD